MEKASSRLRILALIMVVMFAALFTRLWFLQVLAVEQNRDKARNNSVRTVQTDALRGGIVDARGKELVSNQASLEVRVRPDQLGPEPDRVLLDLADLLGIDVKEITRSLQDPEFFEYQPKPVAEFVSEEVAYYIWEHPRDFPGVTVVETSVREYPYANRPAFENPTFAAHVLGYLGQINETEVGTKRFKGYGVSDLVGRAGLEQSYEKWLRGERGLEKYVVNSDGETLRRLGGQPPTPGHTLVLALDGRVQTAAQQELIAGIDRARTIVDESSGTYLKADGGAAIVLDVETSGIVAMVSWPAYDPEWFVHGLTKQQDRYLNDADKLAPALNRSTQQIYAPGSTFKPFSALAAVKEGIATLGGYYPCPSEYVVPGDESGASFTNWNPVDQGSISIYESLVQSCDTVYYDFGSKFFFRWQQNQLGENSEPFQRDLKAWSFGRGTGVDLPLEAQGTIPDAAFAIEHPEIYPDGPIPGINILLSIGSGETKITPLQLATGYLALANGGKVCRPHLVDRIVDAEGVTVKQIGTRCDRELPYSQAQLNYILNALSGVTSDGTARFAFSGFPLSTYPIAGKTGTAERPPFQDTSWFAGIVPANDPKYVVVAMVEQGGFGSTTAAPIVRRIIERIYGIESTGPISGGSQD